jgi:hypothetical protein
MKTEKPKHSSRCKVATNTDKEGKKNIQASINK